MRELIGGRVFLHSGDCLEVLRTLESNSVDSCVTDPPYHLTSIVKRFGAENSALAQFGKDGAFARASRGFMGKQWDGGDIAFRSELWAEVLRVLKPGGHLVAFSGTRTYHRMACAIEDAGFEIRDQIAWLYGSGFPKSHDVSKAIDKAAGVERERGAQRPAIGMNKSRVEQGYRPNEVGPSFDSIPATDAAREWQGWGTALKPAQEPICLARKPLSEKTVAANVLLWGTGALNIDTCRVGVEIVGWGGARGGSDDCSQSQGRNYRLAEGEARPVEGRWPANVCHDGSEEVVEAFPDAPGQQPYVGPEHGEKLSHGIYGDFGARPPNEPRGDAGSAARFFYSAKADANDRLGSKHPTVKPVDLIQWLCRLVTPPRGVVLDPFAGTGTTGEAAWREGFRATLIEREAEYCADIERRMGLCLAGPDARLHARIKAKNLPEDHGPLFAERTDSQWDEMWNKPFDWAKHDEENGA